MIHPIRYVILCLCLLIPVGVACAYDHNLVTERAWVEDPANNMTLVGVQKAPQTPLNDIIFTQGFSTSAYWIRLHIDPRRLAHHVDKLVIRLRPPYQDQIALYDPLAPNDQVRTTGDYFNWQDDEYRSLNLNFVVPVGTQPRDIWLKLKTNQSTLTSIEVMTEDEVRAADRREEMICMLYLSGLFICLGWALLTRINVKDALVSRYILRETMAILYAFVMLGYLRMFSAPWLPTSWLDPLSNLIIFTFVSVSIWFDARLIAEFKPNPWLLRGVIGLVYLLPIDFVLVLTGHTSDALRLEAWVILLAIVLGVACVISTRAWKEARGLPDAAQPPYSKSFLVGVYSFVALVVLFHRLPLMGLFTAQGEMSLYLNLVYPMLSSLTLVMLVQIRLYRQAKLQRQAQHRLELVELEASKERAQRIEQSNFLKMLAHEMKTPLSVVRMATGGDRLPPKLSTQVERAVLDMNGIIERLLQVERLNDQKIVLQRGHFNLFDIIAPLIDRTGCSDRWIIDCDPGTEIESDPRFVQIVLANLIDNAAKYGAVDQPLYLSAHITDNGQGDLLKIAVENILSTAGAPDPERVFEKYYRSPGAYERTGSGLGLYLSKSLVALMGGHIAMHCESNRVRFHLTLPMGSAK